jgi:hypothetical protein
MLAQSSRTDHIAPSFESQVHHDLLAEVGIANKISGCILAISSNLISRPYNMFDCHPDLSVSASANSIYGVILMKS